MGSRYPKWEKGWYTILGFIHIVARGGENPTSIQDKWRISDQVNTFKSFVKGGSMDMRTESQCEEREIGNYPEIGQGRGRRLTDPRP